MPHHLPKEPEFLGKTAEQILEEIDLGIGVALKMGNHSMDYADTRGYTESAYHLMMFEFLQKFWSTLPEKQRQRASAYAIGAFDEWDNLMRVVEIRNRTLEQRRG